MSEPTASRDHYDAVVVGGGHNGLVAAAYLARAGRSVLVLERLEHTGGAAVSAPAFAGIPTRLSRYSYLVSLLPTRLVEELGLDLELVSRATASYSPVERDGRPGGLLVESEEGEATRASFADLLGDPERGDAEHAAWTRFYADVASLAAVVAPTLMEPLPTERSVREQVDPLVWRDLVERPLGEAVEARFGDDLVRGVVGTDALIGTFASLHDPSLVQNRCLLYHLVGNGTGEWRVPVGGMGAVTDALARAASGAGAEILTGAGVSAIRTGEPGAGGGTEVTWHDGRQSRTVSATRVLAGVAPWVLSILRGQGEQAELKPEGAQLKVNLLLDRLPRLRSGVDPAVAFAGTLHLGESWSELQAAYEDAAAGRVPTRMPGEVYCHSLTDPSILGDVAPGTHTLTYFGLHTPARLFEGDHDGSVKALAVERAIASIDEHLAEPLMECVARDADGRPCVEAKVPQDVERDLAMPGGHIFHGDLDWPWATGRALLDTPARRWGVQTDHEAVLLCGSGSRRGGAVSGLGGHSAAMAALEELAQLDEPGGQGGA